MNNLVVRVAILSLFLTLSACAMPTPLPASSMLPPEIVYGQAPSNFFLKNKISVSDFNYEGANKENGAIVFANFQQTVREALRKGGFLAAPGSAVYKLTGAIKEASIPRCSFGSCESGSAIEYTLTSARTGKVAYSELLVVPYTRECPVFMNDPNPIIMQAYTETLGANVAQLIQVLSRKNSSHLN